MIMLKSIDYKTKTLPNGCHVVTSHKANIDGRPAMKFNGKKIPLYRYAYAKAHGVSVDSLEGKEILHSCDNPLCVNPKHLSRGSHKANMKDMAQKGRARNGTTKLTLGGNKIEKSEDARYDVDIDILNPDGSVDLVEPSAGVDHHPFEEQVEKGKKAQVGATSADGKRKKIADGKWVPIKKERKKLDGVSLAVISGMSKNILHASENKYEIGKAVDGDGKILMSKSGGVASVRFTPAEMSKVRGVRDFIHNHPSGSSFSIQDLVFATEAKLGTMWAVSNGKSYSLQLNYEKIWEFIKSVPEKMFGDTPMKQRPTSVVQVESKRVQEAVHAQLSLQVMMGNMSNEEANVIHSDLITSAFVKRFGGKYRTYEWKGDSLSEIKEKRLEKAYKLHYKMKFQDMPISIENDKGSYREWKDDQGNEGQTFMAFPYGYINLTEGTDGDHVDCYIGPDPFSRRVFVVHQNVPETGEYDEDKCMLGFKNPDDAKGAYLGQYDKPGFFGGMDEYDIDTFKYLLKERKGMKIKNDNIDVEKAFGPVKYLRRYWANNKWKYVYQNDNKPGEKITTDIPPKKFLADQWAKTLDDATVTPEAIFASVDPEAKAKVEAVEKRLETITPTIAKHRISGKGAGAEYSAERMELHADIYNKLMPVDKILAAKPVGNNQPTFLMLGGRGGSGKSWFNGKVYNPANSIVFDADEIKHMLPEFEGWNAAEVHEESSDILEKLLVMARTLNLNVVVDATLKSTDKAVAKAMTFKNEGYRVECHYMHLPRQEAAKRAVKRFMGKTGRYVPVDVVLSNTTNEASFEAVRQISDSWSFRDNTGAPPPDLISAQGEALLKALADMATTRFNPEAFDDYDFDDEVAPADYASDVKAFISMSVGQVEKSHREVMVMGKGLPLYKVNIVKASELVEKAKVSPVGTRAVHGGKKMVKTAQGWKPVGEDGKQKKAKGAPKMSGDFKKEAQDKKDAGSKKRAEKKAGASGKLNAKYPDAKTGAVRNFGGYNYKKEKDGSWYNTWKQSKDASASQILDNKGGKAKVGSERIFNGKVYKKKQGGYGKDDKYWDEVRDATDKDRTKIDTIKKSEDRKLVFFFGDLGKDQQKPKEVE